MYGEYNFTLTEKEAGTVPSKKLCTGGENRWLTRQNAEEYIKLTIKALLNQARPQMDKIREGIIFITGEKLLDALSWRYAEERACGKHFTDLEYLKKFTNYEGIYHNPNGKERKWFWEIMEEMDEEDRQLYLRFVNGQSKLATDLSVLRYKHKLTEMRGGDSRLPIAHTCYNTIDLP
jgi:hypothetical protein